MLILSFLFPSYKQQERPTHLLHFINLVSLMNCWVVKLLILFDNLPAYF